MAARLHKKVYVLCLDERYYKIGKSKQPASRRRDFQCGLPFRVESVHVIETDNATWLEKHLHQKFAGRRVRGEWFALTAEDVAWLKSVGRMDAPADHTAPARRGANGDPAFAAKLRELRLANHLSQPDLATLAGISKQALYSLESEQAMPSLPTLLRLCRALGVSLSEFDDPPR